MSKAKILPQARKDNLVVQKLSDETLVYDLDNHKAHCLNQTVALVWQNCDGIKTFQQMGEILQDQFNLPLDEKIILLSLSQLDKAHLIVKETVSLPVSNISRREIIKSGAAATLALPFITSIVSPKASFSASPFAPPFDDSSSNNRWWRKIK